MSIKQTYDNVADIPEGIEALYEQTDTGGYQVKTIDGLVSKDKVDEFRENNIGLRKMVEGFELKALEHEQTITDMQEKLKGFEKVQSTKSVESNTEFYKKEIASLEAKHLADQEAWDVTEKSLNQKVYDNTVGSEIASYAGKHVIPEGQEDFISNVTRKVELIDGEHMVGGQLLTEHLKSIDADSPYGYLLNKPSSTGPGTGSSSITPFSGVVGEDSNTTHDNILDGLKKL